VTDKDPALLRYRAHPWHGIFIGHDAPAIVAAYIEIVPTDTVKYEMDKTTGILKVDRPQKYSSSCPTLYGFIPQTYCGKIHGTYTSDRIGRPNIVGDGDPLDICVLTEKVISRGDILLRAIPIGGLQLIDQNQADDKIIAVLQADEMFGKYKTIEDCPPGFLDRLRHYFLTYKQPPGEIEHPIEITHLYGKEEAYRVIDVCRQDYRAEFSRLFEES
jgi:inorganic pyrophosphatase